MECDTNLITNLSLTLLLTLLLTLIKVAMIVSNELLTNKT
jgi:hypothetical protein